MNDVEFKHLVPGKFITPLHEFTDHPKQGPPVKFLKGKKYLVTNKLDLGIKLMWNQRNIKHHWLLIKQHILDNFATVAK